MLYAYYSDRYAGMVESESVIVLMQMMYNEEQSGTIFRKDTHGNAEPYGTYTYILNGGRFEGWVTA